MPSHQPCVLVTRPQHQAADLLTHLTNCHFKAMHFPVITIEDTHHSEQNLAVMEQINTFNLAIFISQNAVTYGLRLLNTTQQLRHLPPVATIGRSTCALLEANGITVTACPSVPNSKALLDTPSVKNLPASSKVIIFRGIGGKETLAETLRARRITPYYAEVYRRLKPSGISLSLADTQPDLIMVTSADSLQNLFTLTITADRERLLNTPIIIGSKTMTQLYNALGFKQAPIVADSPLDNDMATAAQIWRQMDQR